MCMVWSEGMLHISIKTKYTKSQLSGVLYCKSFLHKQGKYPSYVSITEEEAISSSSVFIASQTFLLHPLMRKPSSKISNHPSPFCSASASSSLNILSLNVLVANAPHFTYGKTPLDFPGFGFRPHNATGCQWKSLTKQGISREDMDLGSDGISGVVTRQSRKADLDLVRA